MFHRFSFSAIRPKGGGASIREVGCEEAYFLHLTHTKTHIPYIFIMCAIVRLYVTIEPCITAYQKVFVFEILRVIL